MKRQKVSSLRIAVYLLVLGAIGSFFGFYWIPSSLTVNRYAMRLPGWTRAPLTVAVLSDLHIGAPYIDLAKVEKIVALTNAQKPDMILLAGDYVVQGVVGGEPIAPNEFAPILGRLHAPLGVYGVLGNHDWWYGGPAVERALQKAGITMLRNRAVRLGEDGAAFQLAGIDDFQYGSPDIVAALRGARPELPLIILTHEPDIFPKLPEGFALAIAGHTHGGQVRLPLLGSLIVPSEYGQRFAFGEITEGARHYFVSPGIGTSILPVRFGVTPEISLLRLEGEAAQPAR